VESPSWEFWLPRLVKKFPAFYGTCKFTAVFTKVRQLSVTCARWVRFTTSYLVSLRSIFISTSNLFLRLPSSTFFRFPQKIPYKFCYMPHPLLFPWFDCPNNIWWAEQNMRLLTAQFSPIYCHFFPLRHRCLSLSLHFSDTILHCSSYLICSTSESSYRVTSKNILIRYDKELNFRDNTNRNTQKGE
jgi:hypothetical protein